MSINMFEELKLSSEIKVTTGFCVLVMLSVSLGPVSVFSEEEFYLIFYNILHVVQVSQSIQYVNYPNLTLNLHSITTEFHQGS